MLLFVSLVTVALAATFRSESVAVKMAGGTSLFAMLSIFCFWICAVASASIIDQFRILILMVASIGAMSGIFAILGALWTIGFVCMHALP